MAFLKDLGSLSYVYYVAIPGTLAATTLSHNIPMLHFLSVAFHPLIVLLDAVIYYPFLNILHLIIWAVPGHNAFWGILGLTLLVRFALLVPSKRVLESQRKMNGLQPQMAELKAEYGDDKNGYAMAQMELYKKNGINPAGSCLPTLFQFLFLIILYQAVLHGLAVNTAHLYGWIPKVTTIGTSFLGFNLLKPDHFFILPILAAAGQYLQAKMLLPKAIPGQEEDQSMAIQRQMVYFAPAMYLLVAFRLPAGAVMYVIIGTVFTVIQQRYVKREQLKVSGVDQALAEGAKEHPENKAKFEEVKQIVESSAKGGVKLTVRKKK
jgi:YidC/Oxa1 family membrane protein insertase